MRLGRASPHLDETLRIKAFLIVIRNQVRDYIGMAGLSENMGVGKPPGFSAHRRLLRRRDQGRHNGRDTDRPPTWRSSTEGHAQPQRSAPQQGPAPALAGLERVREQATGRRTHSGSPETETLIGENDGPCFSKPRRVSGRPR